MGFDITFHPVSVEEAQFFVFDVLNRPDLAKERAFAISRNPEKSDRVLGLYEDLIRLSDPTTWNDEGSFASTVAYLTAGIIGFLHPYWYSRDGAISFLSLGDKRVLNLFRSWTQSGSGAVARMPDPSAGLLINNYHGSGFIEPAHLATVEAMALEVARKLQSDSRKTSPVISPDMNAACRFDENGLSSLLNAIRFAKGKGLGLMEAADVVIPINDQCLSDPDHFRAAIAGNEDDFSRQREV